LITHGFHSNWSINTNLLTFYYNIIDCINGGNQADLIYTDFAKAFDRLNHFLSSQQLNNIGIDDPMLSWLSSSIYNRLKIIEYKHFFLSNCIYFSFGVTQGFHLFPLLFS